MVKDVKVQLALISKFVHNIISCLNVINYLWQYTYGTYNFLILQ